MIAGSSMRVPCINVSESINVVIKRWQDFKTNDFCRLAMDLKQLVGKPKSDVRRAFVGLKSSSTLRPE